MEERRRSTSPKKGVKIVAAAAGEAEVEEKVKEEGEVVVEREVAVEGEVVVEEVVEEEVKVEGEVGIAAGVEMVSAGIIVVKTIKVGAVVVGTVGTSAGMAEELVVHMHTEGRQSHGRPSSLPEQTIAP